MARKPKKMKVVFVGAHKAMDRVAKLLDREQGKKAIIISIPYAEVLTAFQEHHCDLRSLFFNFPNFLVLI